MDIIGGLFPFETLRDKNNGFFEKITPENGEIKHLLSGRCAIFLALEDYKKKDLKKVAYVPMYTCETVLDPFLKSGYELIFYPLDTNLKPVFDKTIINQISIILICGYYGFSTYDKAFIDKCASQKICVIQDITHTMFSSDGISSKASYVVGSLRKWIGIPSGGFAIKTNGYFSPALLSPPESHLKLRFESSLLKKQALSQANPDSYLRQSNEKFWEGELQLRQIYYLFSDDQLSSKIAATFDVDFLKSKRRENYLFLLNNFPKSIKWHIIFPDISSSTVPSHFTIYADNPDDVKKHLTSKGIYASTFWPLPPMVELNNNFDTSFIYSHIISIPCDQRYSKTHMKYICKVFKNISDPFEA